MGAFEITRTRIADPLEVISVEEAKNFIRAVPNDDDEIVEEIILSAFDWAEEYIQAAIIEQEITAHFDGGVDKAYLPFSPIKEIEAAPDAAQFYGGLKKRVTYLTNEPFSIEYVAGMENVSSSLIIAIKKLITFLYENRGEASVEVPKDIKEQFAPFRNVWI